MKKILLGISLALLFSISAFGQQPDHVMQDRQCAEDIVFERQNQNPQTLKIREELEARTQQFIARGTPCIIPEWT